MTPWKSADYLSTRLLRAATACHVCIYVRIQPAGLAEPKTTESLGEKEHDGCPVGQLLYRLEAPFAEFLAG
jgi:hypothetical protein